MVETVNFKGTQSPSTAHGKHVQCLEISFLWHGLNLELKRDEQKFLQSSVLTEIIQISVLTLFCGICAPAAWGVYFPAAVMDRVFWPGEHTSEWGCSPWNSCSLGCRRETCTLLKVAFPPGPHDSLFPLKWMFSPKDNLFKEVQTGFQLLFITLVFCSKNLNLNIKSIWRTWVFPSCSIFVRWAF